MRENDQGALPLSPKAQAQTRCTKIKCSQQAAVTAQPRGTDEQGGYIGGTLSLRFLALSRLNSHSELASSGGFRLGQFGSCSRSALGCEPGSSVWTLESVVTDTGFLSILESDRGIYKFPEEPWAGEKYGSSG